MAVTGARAAFRTPRAAGFGGSDWQLGWARGTYGDAVRVVRRPVFGSTEAVATDLA
jgi:hypothetical protein